MESEKGSLLETMNIIEGVKKTLTGRIAGKFVPFAVRNIFAQNVQIETECEHLKAAFFKCIRMRWHISTHGPSNMMNSKCLHG
ncbi:hypothetical protein Bhyg_04231 [Pseudolycoriella hygida]|uniref:Uncharacterized protein n=1 Tax=Pseudolycoriella hygida TaxID=35572 RepID=A0A9Q0S868_9DIPT|nr:hypothetical protein Bhyg_04231 [Pseudolycoriella hygida]